MRKKAWQRRRAGERQPAAPSSVLRLLPPPAAAPAPPAARSTVPEDFFSFSVDVGYRRPGWTDADYAREALRLLRKLAVQPGNVILITRMADELERELEYRDADHC